MTPTPTSPQPKPQNTGSKILIGLLVGCGCLTFGVIVVGIIAAISLPSFLDQVGRARTSEATSNIGTILRAQQAYRLGNGKFATSITDLDARITANYYTYEIIPQTSVNGSVVIAKPARPDIPGVVGVVFFDKVNDTYSRQICVSEGLNPEPPPAPEPPTVAGGKIECPTGSKAFE